MSTQDLELSLSMIRLTLSPICWTERYCFMRSVYVSFLLWCLELEIVKNYQNLLHGPYVYSTSFLWWWCIHLHQVVYSLPTSLQKLSCLSLFEEGITHIKRYCIRERSSSFITLIKHCSPTTVNDKVTALPRLIRVHLPVVHTHYLCFLYMHWNWNIVDHTAYFTEIVYPHFCSQFQFSVLISI